MGEVLGQDREFFLMNQGGSSQIGAAHDVRREARLGAPQHVRELMCGQGVPGRRGQVHVGRKEHGAVHCEPIRVRGREQGRDLRVADHADIPHRGAQRALEGVLHAQRQGGAVPVSLKRLDAQLSQTRSCWLDWHGKRGPRECGKARQRGEARAGDCARPGARGRFQDRPGEGWRPFCREP